LRATFSSSAWKLRGSGSNAQIVESGYSHLKYRTAMPMLAPQSKMNGRDVRASNK
jgi:hypothetical protein